MDGDGELLVKDIYGHIPRDCVLDTPPKIGSTPPNFITLDIPYERPDIIRLIIFYNNAFGVVKEDEISLCVLKFYRFLTTF